jgi:hypothetical protein
MSELMVLQKWVILLTILHCFVSLVLMQLLCFILVFSSLGNWTESLLWLLRGRDIILLLCGLICPLFHALPVALVVLLWCLLVLDWVMLVFGRTFIDVAWLTLQCACIVGWMIPTTFSPSMHAVPVCILITALLHLAIILKYSSDLSRHKSLLCLL